MNLDLFFSSVAEFFNSLSLLQVLGILTAWTLCGLFGVWIEIRCEENVHFHKLNPGKFRSLPKLILLVARILAFGPFILCSSIAIWSTGSNRC